MPTEDTKSLKRIRKAGMPTGHRSKMSGDKAYIGFFKVAWNGVESQKRKSLKTL